MIYKENKDIDYISKWLRIPIKKFILCMNRYNKWINNRSKDVQTKNKWKLKEYKTLRD